MIADTPQHRAVILGLLKDGPLDPLALLAAVNCTTYWGASISDLRDLCAKMALDGELVIDGGCVAIEGKS